MITFEPPELKDEFIRTIRALHDFGEITLNDCPDWHDDDFNFEEADDDTIERNSTFAFDVGADGSPEFTVAELIELAAELPRSKTVDRLYYEAPTRAYLRVEARNEAAYQFVNHLDAYPIPTHRRFETTFENMKFALVNGFTPFAIHMFKDGEYDSDTYPTYHDSDLFVELRYPGGTTTQAWRALVPSFLFELDEQTGLAFGQAPRGAYSDIWPADYDETTYLQKLKQSHVGC